MTAMATGWSPRSRPFPGSRARHPSPWAMSTTTASTTLVVGAGKDHAPEVVAYAGKAKDGKGSFETELARFEAFDSAARGGVSVASSQIDGSTADNIIVGSGPGILKRSQGLSREAAAHRRARRPSCSRRSVPISTTATA